MLAQKFTVSAKATTVVGAPKTAKRGVTIVRRNSKGGEEGARDFGNSAMAMVVKAASYSLLGAAITKVRNYSNRCVPSHARSARASRVHDGRWGDHRARAYPLGCDPERDREGSLAAPRERCERRDAARWMGKNSSLP